MKSKIQPRISNRKKNSIIIGCIIALGIILRLFYFSTTIADNNSNLQAQTLLIAKGIENGSAPIGRYEETELERKIEKKEPPLYNPSKLLLYETKIALSHKLLPFLSLEQIARIINIEASIVIIFCLFFLTLRLQDKQSAIFAALFASSSPFVILQSHQTTNFTSTLAMICAATVLYYLSSISKRRKSLSRMYFFSSSLFMSLSVATNPIMIVFILPILYMAYQQYSIEILHSSKILLYLLVTLIPTIIINFALGTLPQLLPLPIWTTHIENVVEQTGILFFQRKFFTILIQERLINLILGTMGIAFVISGMFRKYKKSNIFHWFAISALVSVLLFPGEHFAHLSFQSFFIPVLALYFGTGVGLILSTKREFTINFASFMLLCAIFAFSLFVSFNETKPHFVKNQGSAQIAKIIETLTQESDMIATDTKGDPILLYLSNRAGIPTTDNGDFELKNAGVDYIVTSNADYAATLEQQYQVVFRSKNAFILNLNK